MACLCAYKSRDMSWLFEWKLLVVGMGPGRGDRQFRQGA